MIKKVVIEILLVEECAEKSDKEIEKDIVEEFSRNLHLIPWAAKIQKVAVKRN
jgi:hypothetical protein